MQTVTITLTDGDEGNLNVELRCEPEVDMNAPCTSQAVYGAMKMMEFLQQLVAQTKEINESTPQIPPDTTDAN